MKTADTIAISLTKIAKKYTLHHEKPTLTERIIRGKDEEFFALDAITLNIFKGERIGLIGPNGCGKTTLLKIIARIATPSSGTVFTYGNIVSLIDLEAGFHLDLTGEQNIFLNGILLGMNKKEIMQKKHQIIKFADIDQFIDAPLFTYSDGMKLRLGFAIAIHADPDIILLDEGVGVGDKTFQAKSMKKLSEFISRKKTVIIVSHQLSLIKKYCSRVVLLRQGKIYDDGKPLTIIHRYLSQKD